MLQTATEAEGYRFDPCRGHYTFRFRGHLRAAETPPGLQLAGQMNDGGLPAQHVIRNAGIMVDSWLARMLVANKTDLMG